jgi:GTP-binding protein Era
MLNRPDSQIIFVDTPGLHSGSGRAMNRHMNRAAVTSLNDADVNIFVIEALSWGDEEQRILDQLVKRGQPIVTLVNKVDKIVPRERLPRFGAHLESESEFKRVHRVPSLSADTAGYDPDGGLWLAG